MMEINTKSMELPERLMSRTQQLIGLPTTTMTTINGVDTIDSVSATTTHRGGTGMPLLRIRTTAAGHPSDIPSRIPITMDMEGDFMDMVHTAMAGTDIMDTILTDTIRVIPMWSMPAQLRNRQETRVTGGQVGGD
jgi:hypothetical protein